MTDPEPHWLPRGEDGWHPVLLSRLTDRRLADRMCRVISRVHFDDGREVLALTAQGLYRGVRRDEHNHLYVSLIPDPDAEHLVDDYARQIAQQGLDRIRAAITAGEKPPEELFGPLGVRTLIQFDGDPL